MEQQGSKARRKGARGSRGKANRRVQNPSTKRGAAQWKHDLAAPYPVTAAHLNLSILASLLTQAYLSSQVLSQSLDLKQSPEIPQMTRRRIRSKKKEAGMLKAKIRCVIMKPKDSWIYVRRWLLPLPAAPPNRSAWSP